LKFFFKISFEKFSNTKFHENLSSGSQVFPYRQTDRHHGANVQLRNFWERTLN